MEEIIPCPRCGKTLLLQVSKMGNRFVKCPDTKKCQYIADTDENWQPVKAPETGIVCEKCGSPMTIKTQTRGPFLACTRFPKCLYAKAINDELQKKLKDILPRQKSPAVSKVESSPKNTGTPKPLSGTPTGGRQSRFVFSFGESASPYAFSRGAEQNFVRELQGREWNREGPSGADLSKHCDPDVKSLADLVRVAVKNLVDEAKLPSEVVQIPFDKLSALMNEGGWSFVGGAFQEFESHNSDTEITVVLAGSTPAT